MKQRSFDKNWATFAAEHVFCPGDILLFIPQSLISFGVIIFNKKGIEKLYSWHFNFTIHLTQSILPSTAIVLENKLQLISTRTKLLCRFPLCILLHSIRSFLYMKSVFIVYLVLFDSFPSLYEKQYMFLFILCSCVPKKKPINLRYHILLRYFPSISYACLGIFSFYTTAHRAVYASQLLYIQD